MTSNDRLREAIVKSSRIQATRDLGRFHRMSSLSLTTAFAGGLTLALWLRGRRRTAVLAAALTCAACIARGMLGNERPGQAIIDDADDNNAHQSPVDELSRQSFPASDPPSMTRTTAEIR